MEPCVRERCPYPFGTLFRPLGSASRSAPFWRRPSVPKRGLAGERDLRQPGGAVGIDPTERRQAYCRHLARDHGDQRAEPLRNSSNELEGDVHLAEEGRIIADRDELGSPLTYLVDGTAHARKRAT